MFYIITLFIIYIIVICLCGDGGGGGSVTTYSKNIWGEKTATTKSNNRHVKKTYGKNIWGEKTVTTKVSKKCFSCGRMVKSNNKGFYHCCNRKFR